MARVSDMVTHPALLYMYLLIGLLLYFSPATTLLRCFLHACCPSLSPPAGRPGRGKSERAMEGGSWVSHLRRFLLLRRRQSGAPSRAVADDSGPSPAAQGRFLWVGGCGPARGGSGPTLPCPPVGRRAESRRRRRFRAIAGSPGPFFVGGRLRPGPRRSGPTPSVNVTLRTDCCRAVNREKLGETARVRERA